MTNYLLTTLSLLPLFTLTFLFLVRHHLLMILLFLEATTLIFALLLPLLTPPAAIFLMPMLLTLSACEASLGLALLVMMVRSTGTDMVKSLMINKC